MSVNVTPWVRALLAECIDGNEFKDGIATCKKHLGPRATQIIEICNQPIIIGKLGGAVWCHMGDGEVKIFARLSVKCLRAFHKDRPGPRHIGTMRRDVLSLNSFRFIYDQPNSSTEPQLCLEVFEFTCVKFSTNKEITLQEGRTELEEFNASRSSGEVWSKFRTTVQGLNDSCRVAWQSLGRPTWIDWSPKTSSLSEIQGLRRKSRVTDEQRKVIDALNDLSLTKKPTAPGNVLSVDTHPIVLSAPSPSAHPIADQVRSNERVDDEGSKKKKRKLDTTAAQTSQNEAQSGNPSGSLAQQSIPAANCVAFDRVQGVAVLPSASPPMKQESSQEGQTAAEAPIPAQPTMSFNQIQEMKRKQKREEKQKQIEQVYISHLAFLLDIELYLTDSSHPTKSTHRVKTVTQSTPSNLAEMMRERKIERQKGTAEQIKCIDPAGAASKMVAPVLAKSDIAVVSSIPVLPRPISSPSPSFLSLSSAPIYSPPLASAPLVFAALTSPPLSSVALAFAAPASPALASPALASPALAVATPKHQHHTIGTKKALVEMDGSEGEGTVKVEDEIMLDNVEHIDIAASSDNLVQAAMVSRVAQVKAEEKIEVKEEEDDEVLAIEAELARLERRKADVVARRKSKSVSLPAIDLPVAVLRSSSIIDRSHSPSQIPSPSSTSSAVGRRSTIGDSVSDSGRNQHSKDLVHDQRLPSPADVPSTTTPTPSHETSHTQIVPVKRSSPVVAASSSKQPRPIAKDLTAASELSTGMDRIKSIYGVSLLSCEEFAAEREKRGREVLKSL